MQFLPPAPRFAPPGKGFGGGVTQPAPFPIFGAPVFPFPVFGFGGYLPYGYYDYPDYGYRYVPGVLDSPPGVPVAPTDPGVALANEFPAKLTVQFPAAAEVWLNGKKTDGKGEEQVLTSPVLRPGQTFTFEVKARWQVGGKTYEANRTVTLAPGDKSRLFVVSGTEVKE
jgi:uncharacterized protein (TIGR03000 family)